MTADSEGSFRKCAPDGKVHLIRVRARREEGRVIVSPSGLQGSGILSSALRSNAFALVPEDANALTSGDAAGVHEGAPAGRAPGVEGERPAARPRGGRRRPVPDATVPHDATSGGRIAP